MTVVINLFGTPGTGKSTIACDLFARMKHEGYNVELVREYVKELCWQDIQVSNQLKCLAIQYDRQLYLDGKVDFIITDSPLLLSVHYGKDNKIDIPSLAKQLHRSFTRVDVMLNRVKKYNPSGRYHSESESDNMLESIRNLPTCFDLHIDADKNAANKILNYIKNRE